MIVEHFIGHGHSNYQPNFIWDHIPSNFGKHTVEKSQTKSQLWSWNSFLVRANPNYRPNLSVRENYTIGKKAAIMVGKLSARQIPDTFLATSSIQVGFMWQSSPPADCCQQCKVLGAENFWDFPCRSKCGSLSCYLVTIVWLFSTFSNSPPIYHFYSSVVQNWVGINLK